MGQNTELLSKTIGTKQNTWVSGNITWVQFWKILIKYREMHRRLSKCEMYSCFFLPQDNNTHVKQRELRKLWTFGRLEQMFRLTPRNESLGLLIKSKIKSSLPNVQDILVSLN